MKQLKIAVIGSGSTYTPELINGFISRKNKINVGAYCFMDIDKGKNEIVGGLSKRMLLSNGINTDIMITDNLEEAIKDADYVLGQIRIGGLEARIYDEKIPLKHDLIGQETTGAGGFMNALRTIPAMMDIVKTIEKSAPNAWLINFSNPSGLIAEALLNFSNIKMIGLCNGPINMIKSVKEMIPYEIMEFDYDFVGLNHLCWITKIYVNGKEIRIKDLYAKITEQRTNCNVYMEKALDAYPSSYLNYYYFREDELKKLKNKKNTRGEECVEIEKALLELYLDPELNSKPEILNKRGGALYSEAAVSLIDAIENDKNEIHVVNVKNNGAYSFMDNNDVVEAKCNINKDGATPLNLGTFDDHYIKGLMRSLKAYEKLTVEASLNGDYNKALVALMIHPLIGDHHKARNVLDEMLKVNKRYLPQF